MDIFPNVQFRLLPPSNAAIKSRAHKFFTSSDDIVARILQLSSPTANKQETSRCKHRMHPRLPHLFSFAVLVILTVLAPTRACTCILTTLERSYFAPFTRLVVHATPVASFVVGTRLIYTVRVQTVYKGCVKKRTLSVQSSDVCRAFLQLRKSYLLTLGSGSPLTVSLCNVSAFILIPPLQASAHFSLHPVLTLFFLLLLFHKLIPPRHLRTGSTSENTTRSLSANSIFSTRVISAVEVAAHV